MKSWSRGPDELVRHEVGRLHQSSFVLRRRADRLAQQAIMRVRKLTGARCLDAFQALGQTLSVASADEIAGREDFRPCWPALGRYLDFQRREMETGRAALGDSPAQNAQLREDQIRNWTA